MKDFPMFTTENGAAALVMREIPYRKTAYVKIHSSETPEVLLEECISFCRACGAEKIYGSGHPYLEQYPFYTALWKMAADVAAIPETDACLWPVMPETAEQFREIYNRRMADVPNAAFMTVTERENMLTAGDGYFVHRGNTLLGIGRAYWDHIKVVIGLEPGAGADVLAALCSLLTEERAVLEVASANERAVKLYKRMGFIPIEELSRWYEIF